MEAGDGSVVKSLGSPASGVDGPPTPLLGHKESIRAAITELFNTSLDLIVTLFSTVLRELLFLDPEYLDELEHVNELSQFAFFLLLGVFGLSTLGYIQFFPASEKSDPLRFARRALPATLSLWIINPPGPGTSLFSRGAFAWAFVATNQLSKVFLLEMRSVSVPRDALADALGGTFLLLGFTLSMSGVVILAELLLFIGLALRQLLVLVVYGMYPLLIAFWVVDVGPLKYCKKLSTKLFKTTVTLIVGGVLIAAVFAVGLGLMANSNQVFAGGTAAASGGTHVGVFSGGAGVDVIFATQVKLWLLLVMCVLPLLMIKQMLGDLGDAAASALFETINLATSAVAAVATGGAGGLAVTGAATAAKQAGKQAAKQGVKQTVKKVGKTVAKKGAGGAAKHAARQGASAAKSAGVNAAKRAPGAAKDAGKKAIHESRAAGESMAKDGLSGSAAGADVEDDEDDPGVGQSAGSNSTVASKPKPVSTASASTGSDGSSGPGGSPSSGSDSESSSGPTPFSRLRGNDSGSDGPTNPSIDGSETKR